MQAVVLPPTVLVCPNCPVRVRRATSARPGWHQAEMHPCAGLRGLAAPLVPEGQVCKVEAVARGDYVGADAGRVRTDGEGRPWMAVRTTHDDHDDLVVFAPLANGEARAT